ncbi:MAG: hypothetical protein K9M99_12505 [Candidatus Cloacimonetes bacterium]|nr:hypothetical protein [Candidatus Cloacimonadota bacterium]
MKFRFLVLILLLSINLISEVWLPCPKPLSGHIEASAGLHFWSDHLYLRNLQIRSLLYICPGIRINGLARGNQEINQLELSQDAEPVYNKLDPIIDEGYLELFGHYLSHSFKLNSSLRCGRIRYLEFPESSLISRFDHVAGMSDIRANYLPSGYNGAILITNFSWHNLSWHNSLYQKEYNSLNIIQLDSYLSCHYDYEFLQLEARAGKLPVRDHGSDAVLEECAWGWSCLMGINWQGYDINIYLENVKEIIYTGLSIKFASSPLTRLAGKLRLDYNRACEGFVFQYPLFYQDINLKTKKPEGLTKVGEIKAERAISFWRIGMQRNFSESIVSRSGITNPAITTVVIKKEPMLLGIESIVSPVYKFHKLNDIAKWDNQGIRPGILTQKVIYEYYQ